MRFDRSPSPPALLTDAAADLLESAFGLTIQLNGGQFGLAATSPQQAPLPAAKRRQTAWTNAKV